MAFKFEIPESVQRELDEREKQETKAVIEREKNGVIQFPLPWANDKRGVPSSLLRSALFGIVRRGRRAYVENFEIAAWAGTSIKYTGMKLMQSDQDVWMACVEACKRQGKSDIVISQRELMKIAGRNGGDTKRLWVDLKRLVCANCEVKDGRYTYIGNLIHDAVKDEKSGHIALSINPKMLVLFGGNVTHIDVENRHMLKMDLTKWLHGYVCSHQSSFRKPHFIRLENLKSLCGSETIIREYRKKIRSASAELKTAKIIAGWLLENDVLKIWR